MARLSANQAFLHMAHDLAARSLDEALARVQATERNPRLRTVYMSGASPEESRVAAALRPGMAFLAKPFSAGQLVQAIEWVLDAPGEAAPVTRPPRPMPGIYPP